MRAIFRDDLLSRTTARVALSFMDGRRIAEESVSQTDVKGNNLDHLR